MIPGSIVVENLGKRFTPQARPLTQLRRALFAPVAASASGVVGGGGGATTAEDPSAHWAFRHLNLRLEPGASLGVIGRNGAGKSTLLTVLAGILQPDEGVCSAAGRIGTLLEIAAGFHPEFSGRENVELALQVAGLSRREIAARIEAVKDFAAIGAAFEDPVRTYSSGMLLRAAYAHITAVESDILLIDEVLAVGDALFQARCFDHLKSLRAKQVTRVLVSHDLSAIVAQCDHVAVLDRGQLVFLGEPAQAVDFYRRDVLADAGRLALAADPAQRAVMIAAVSVTAPDGRRLEVLHPGETVVFALELIAHRPVRDLHAGLEFHTPQGWMLGAVSTLLTPTRLPELAAGQRLTVRFELPLPFNPGRVNLHAGVTGQADGDGLDRSGAPAALAHGGAQAPDARGAALRAPPSSPPSSAPSAPPPPAADLPFLDRRENLLALEIVGDPAQAYGAVRLAAKVMVDAR